MNLKFPEQESSEEKSLARILLTFIFLFWVFYLGKILIIDRPDPALKIESKAGLISDTPPPPSVSASKLTLSGSIVPLIERTNFSGTHRLVGSDGKVIAILKSRNLDLNFTIAGVSAEVTGKKERTVENNLPLINVESIRYRSAQ